jgi:site-specific DNA-methyltransferase (adenine-specific)
MTTRLKPGSVRDAIVASLQESRREMTTAEIHDAVVARLGIDVPSSSVRSYLGLNTPGLFIRTNRGTYRLVRR